jgi:hypothetical protein
MLLWKPAIDWKATAIFLHFGQLNSLCLVKKAELGAAKTPHYLHHTTKLIFSPIDLDLQPDYEKNATLAVRASVRPLSCCPGTCLYA